MFSSGEVEILPLYEVKLAAEVTVANMVSDLKHHKQQTIQTNLQFQLKNASYRP